MYIGRLKKLATEVCGMIEGFTEEAACRAAGAHAIGRSWARDQDGGILAVHVGRREVAHWQQPPCAPT